MRSPSTFILLLLIAAASIGCGESPPPQYRVQGTVRWNEKPVEGATVKFSKDGTGWIITTETDAQGHYELEAYEGANKVSVTKVRKEEATDPEGAKTTKSVHLIPPAYSSPYQSGLKTTIETNDDNLFDITLQGRVAGQSS